MTRIVNPFEVYTDLTGEPLESGKIYIGVSNLNPETNPISVWYDEEFSQPVTQPIRTVSGYPSRNGSPANIFTEESLYSITVRDKSDGFIFTSESVFSEVIDNTPQRYGAVGNGTVAGGGNDDSDAIEAAIAAGAAVFGSPAIRFPPGNYRVTRPITFTSMTVFSENARIIKDHAGVGFIFAGGSGYNTFDGSMTIKASTAHTHDMLSSHDDGEHGIEINSRMVVSGRLISQGHKGNAIHQVGNTNCNYSTYERIEGLDSERGFNQLITTDDSAVWNGRINVLGNWQTGYRVDPASLHGPRSYNIFIGSENNGRDGTSPGTLINSGNGSKYFVYSENQNGGVDLELGQASPTTLENLSVSEVHTSRNNTITNHVSDNGGVKLLHGGNQVIIGTTDSQESSVTALNVNNDVAKYWEKNWFTSASGNPYTRQIRGSGEKWNILRNISTPENKSINQESKKGRTLVTYSGASGTAPDVEENINTIRGTESAVVDVSVGDVAWSRSYILEASGDYVAARKWVSVTAVGGGNKASVNFNWEVTENGTTTKHLLQYNNLGNLALGKSGAGLTVTSPNGGTTLTISIDNAGNVVAV